MRRLRPFPLYWSAILAVVLGAVAVPATALADGEDALPTDGTAPSADRASAAPTPPAPSEAEPSGGDDAPTPPTTAEPGDEAPAAESPDAPAPETTTPATDPGPVPSTPPRTQVGSATSESPTTAAPPVEPTPGDDELEQDAFGSYPDGIVRPIAFPVLGPVRYANGWGNCRDGCARRHVGTDIIGVRMQPLLAAVDGTITRIRHENEGTAGVVITITGADGWYYNYFHVNNDNPGTDDGAAGPQWQVLPQLSVGSPVRAGQVIGYMGDSGNAEGSVPHLHFEIRQPDRTPVNPYPSLAAAEQGSACAETVTWQDPSAVSPDAIAIIPIDDGGRWLIDRDGNLFAEGSAASVHSASTVACAPTEPVSSPVEQPAAAPESPPAEVAPPAPEQPPAAEPTPVQPVAEPAPAEPPVAAPATEAPSSTTWTVEPGQSLWQIAKQAYGVSDIASTVALVDFIVEHNRDQLSDPDVLNTGMELLLPAI